MRIDTKGNSHIGMGTMAHPTILDWIANQQGRAWMRSMWHHQNWRFDVCISGDWHLRLDTVRRFFFISFHMVLFGPGVWASQCINWSVRYLMTFHMEQEVRTFKQETGASVMQLRKANTYILVLHIAPWIRVQAAKLLLGYRKYSKC